MGLKTLQCSVYRLLILHFDSFFLMSKNLKIPFTVMIFSFAMLLSPSIFSNTAFAEEYDFVAGIKNEVTFHFRDGMETVSFPVFSTTSDLVSNIGTTFEVEGVIGDNPYLHKALDEAYKHRLSTLTGGSAFEYDYRFFDVDVNIVQDKTVLKSLDYKNCEVSEYGIATVTDDYESYMLDNSGFAIVNSIEFRCGGVHINPEETSEKYVQPAEFVDYGSLPFAQAEDVHTFLTFDFDHGSEKIESVIFTLTGGFNESDYGTPSFQIITAVLPHPMIDNAIVKSQKVSGVPSSFNEDFDVSVEFVSTEKIRGLDFEDCIVSGYGILTLRDKEEGYTGKRGFATAEVLDVECSGLNTINPGLSELVGEANSSLSLSNISHSYNMGNGPHVIATFEFEGGSIEAIDFPEFYQGNLIAKANPTFALVGVPAKTPLLYEIVDDSRQFDSKSTGVSATEKLFDVNLILVYGTNVVRGFDYHKCHVTDYMVKTEHDAEESFYKGFALTNEFHFECLGYQPYDPLYDDMFKTEKANNESSIDRQAKERSTWGPNFRS